jgi:hypothetical protein
MIIDIDKLQQDILKYHPRTLYFSETRRQGGSKTGSIMDGAWCMLEQEETFYIYLKKLYERSMGAI